MPVPGCGSAPTADTSTGTVVPPAGATMSGRPSGKSKVSSASGGPGMPWSEKPLLISL